MAAFSLAAHIAQQIALRAGVTVLVDEENGVIRLSGRVDSEAARRAAEEIAAYIAAEHRIENDLEVEEVLPEVVEEPGMGAAEHVQLEPSFTDQPLLTDAPSAAGSEVSAEEAASAGEGVYFPPTDPVVRLNAHGRPTILGGFAATSLDEVEVEQSTEEAVPGDEALAEAIRRELREDAATTDLEIAVVVRRGVAYLRGRVPGPEDAENAEYVASQVPGVRAVVDELEVAAL